MSKILVKQAVGVDYSLSGQPVMVLGGGRGGRGGQARGRTLRERAGGLLGGTVGVLGALTGQHRSLGGLTQSMISGGAQGAGLGSALGRKTVGRVGQARADIREAGKQARAEEDARLAEATRSRGQGLGSMASIAEKRPRLAAVMNPAAAIRRRNTRIQGEHQQESERLNRANRAREAAQQESGQVLVQQARNKQRLREKHGTAEDWKRGEKAQEELRGLERAFGADEGQLGPSLAAVAAGAQPMQTQSPIDLGGKTAVMRPVTNAAGVQIAPDASQVHPNMLPAPSPSAQEASAGTEIGIIESASDTEAMQTGTDMKDSEDPIPLGDSVDWDKDKSRMTANELDIMRRLNPQQMQQVQQQPQGNPRQTTLPEF